MISYKDKLLGINVLIQEESYTGKCSALYLEKLEKKDEYLRKRVKRGLFKTSNGLLVNADVNGNLNILRKKLNEVSDAVMPADRGFALNPIKIVKFL